MDLYEKHVKKEGVPVIGTLGIIDQLLTLEMISNQEYKDCLQRLQQQNGGTIRLPSAEIDSRLEKCFKEE